MTEVGFGQVPSRGVGLQTLAHSICALIPYYRLMTLHTQLRRSQSKHSAESSRRSFPPCLPARLLVSPTKTHREPATAAQSHCRISPFSPSEAAGARGLQRNLALTLSPRLSRPHPSSHQPPVPRNACPAPLRLHPSGEIPDRSTTLSLFSPGNLPTGHTAASPKRAP